MISRQRSRAAAVVLAAFALSTTAVRAQQPSLPDEAQLYAQMNVAMQRVGSVHIQESTAPLPMGPRQKLREVLAGTADVSSQQQLLHAVYVEKITVVRSHRVVFRQRTDAIAVGDRIAQRTDRRAWSCEPLSPEFWPGPLTALVFLPPVTPHFLGGVGSATVLGVAVWRIKIDLGNRTDVLNIARDTNRLVRITEVRGVKTAADGQHKTFTDFFRYGEPVAVQLPPACT